MSKPQGGFQLLVQFKCGVIIYDARTRTVFLMGISRHMERRPSY